MKPGQVITQWWQEYVLGRLRSPQDIIRAARAEAPDRYEDRFTTEPQETDVWDIPERLKAEAFIRSEAYARQSMRADWQQVDHRLRQFAARVCIAARARGIPVYVHSAFRTKDEQSALLDRRVTKVGWPRSAHNIGEAVDIVHGVYHWELRKDEWLFIHHLAQEVLRKMNAGVPKEKRLHLNWGGDDGTNGDTFRWDPAHWEIYDYRTRLRALPEGVPVFMSPARIASLYR